MKNSDEMAEDIHYFDDNIIAIQNVAKANYNTFAVQDRQTMVNDYIDITGLNVKGTHK